MAELKPCPFCGGEAHAYAYRFSDQGKERRMWVCKCKKCKLNYPPFSVLCEQPSAAIEAWNTRAIERGVGS